MNNYVPEPNYVLGTTYREASDYIRKHDLDARPRILDWDVRGQVHGTVWILPSVPRDHQKVAWVESNSAKLVRSEVIFVASEYQITKTDGWHTVTDSTGPVAKFISHRHAESFLRLMRESG